MRLENGQNPRDIKLELARIITQLYHGQQNVKAAEKYFVTVFQEKKIPDNMPTLFIENDQMIVKNMLSQLVSTGIVLSKSEFLRLVKQNGVSLNGDKLNLDSLDQIVKDGDVLQIGKKRFVKFVQIKCC
ncbi:hypothetical protein MKZ17_10455 [Solibacillus sp. FSL R7-0682]